MEQKPAHKFVYRAVTEINPETYEIVTTMQNAVHGEALGFDQEYSL